MKGLLYVYSTKEIEIDTRRSCTPHNVIELSLDNGKHALGRQSMDLYIPRIGLNSTDGEYVIACYEDTSAERHLLRYMGALYREAGFNAYYFNLHHRYALGNAADSGLFCITGAMYPYFRQCNLSNEHVNCCNKPEIRAEWVKNITNALDDIHTFGSIGRVLDDETSFAYIGFKDGEWQGAQACQCTNCLTLFRETMKNKYKDVAKLNDVWGTQFKSFDEVRVIEENEIKNSDNPSGWLEFRQYMNWTFAHQFYGWVNKQHEPLGPDYGAGPGAPAFTSLEGGPTYKGGDYSFLKDELRFMMAYGGAGGLLYRNAFVGQPGGQKYDPPLEWKERGSWYHLLNGADALWYYLGAAIIGHEMAWRQHAKWIFQGVRDIRDGMGILVSQSRPLNRQVRILYSPENYAMAWLFSKRNDDWNGLSLQGQTTTEKTLTDLLDTLLFIQVGYVTAEEIQKGDLSDCRLLVLPQTLNMDEATAEAIRNWVKDGGRILADVMPAVRERYGKPRSQSLLADVFGVDASGAIPHKEKEAWYSVGIHMSPDENLFSSGDIWLPGQVGFLKLKPITAKPQGKMLSKKMANDTPICFINDFGKGQALLLNFLYCNLNGETFGWHRIFGEALVAWAKLEPQARIVHPVTQESLIFRPLRSFQRGKSLLLGCIRGQLIWSGGPTLTDISRAVDISDNAKFIWKENRHIYNVRDRKYLGYGNSAEVNLPSYEGRLLALLPYKVNTVKIDAPSRVKAGEVFSLSAQVIPEGQQPADEHVLRLEVKSPTGYLNLAYCKTRTAKEGKATFDIPFADNDRQGEWSIVVRDVMTGVEGQTKIQLTR